MIEFENIIFDNVTVGFMIENFMEGLKAHFKEAEHSLSDKELDLNMAALKIFEDQDKLLIIGAKDTSIDKIVGYCAFLIDQSIFAKVSCASELGVYVAPEYRAMGVGANLLLVAEVHLREKGVEIMRMTLKDKNQGMHSEIYNLGYELEELVYHKRI